VLEISVSNTPNRERRVIERRIIMYNYELKDSSHQRDGGKTSYKGRQLSAEGKS
jgi:hypothetical protein